MREKSGKYSNEYPKGTQNLKQQHFKLHIHKNLHATVIYDSTYDKSNVYCEKLQIRTQMSTPLCTLVLKIISPLSYVLSSPKFAK